MPKVSKKKVVNLNCNVNFNRLAVVILVFDVKFLQTLNCFAVIVNYNLFTNFRGNALGKGYDYICEMDSCIHSNHGLK